MKRSLIYSFSFLFTVFVCAQVEVIVNDVGAGHSSIIKLPGSKYALYDVGSANGNWGKAAREKINKAIDPGSTIEFVIISHMDGDHFYAAKSILEDYKVKKIILTGYAKKQHVANRRSKFNELLMAINKSERDKGTEVLNLFKEGRMIRASDNIQIGDVQFDFLCGFNRALTEWEFETNKLEPKRINGSSIVMRMNYKGASVLFTGDAVGRMLRDTVTSLKATEKWLYENKKERLDVEVVIAPHHGADNGSSKAFCEATSPDWVIFPAGDKNLHPVKQTVDRYHEFGGVSYDSMFRTDRGEGYVKPGRAYQRYLNTLYTKLKEWAGQSKKGCKDEIGDDDVLISISNQGVVSVAYMKPDPCE